MPIDAVMAQASSGYSQTVIVGRFEQSCAVRVPADDHGLQLADKVRKIGIFQS